VKRFAIIWVSLTLVGCANKSLVRFEKLSKASAAQDFKRAVAEVRKDKRLYGSQSQLLYHLDLGILFHYAGLYDSSIAEFENANRIHDALFTKSVSNEALSLVTNDNVRPYRGKHHEIVLMHLFQTFNYLAKNQVDEALVEARQTQLFFQELQRTQGGNDKAYVDDGLFRAIAALCYEAAGQTDDALISLFQSIKAYQSQRIPPPPSLLQYASRAFADNDRKQDLDLLKLENPKPASPHEPQFGESAEVILVGQSGKAPMLDQTVFWGTWVRDGVLVVHWRGPNGVVTETLPAPGIPDQEYQKASKGRRTRSGTTFHIKFSMPSYQAVPYKSGPFELVANGSVSRKSETYADLDDLLKRYLDESHTTLLTRTVIRVVLRTIASEKTKSSLRTDNPLLNLFVNVGTDVLADQLEQADSRTWFLLPNRIEIARIALPPGKHRIEAHVLDRNGNRIRTQPFGEIELKPRQKKFLFVPSWQ
jgi:uncharacterized protein